MLRPALWTCVALLGVSAPAAAYDEALHELLTTRATPDDGALLEAPPADEVEQFRKLLWARWTAIPDEALQARLRAIVPMEDAFTPAVLKRLLMLNETRPVAGLDAVSFEPLTTRALLVRASRLPDDDKRNQDRHWTNDDGSVRKDARGEPLPVDPAIVELGGASGLSSQAHAHYELLPASERTSDSAVLDTEPYRFSLPADAHSFGADFAAIYANLATIARTSELPHAAWFTTLFEGNAFHHVQDVCNQIHTVHAGLKDFFVDAQLAVWGQELRSMGGLLGRRIAFMDSAVKIVASHHVLLEDLFSRWATGAAPELANSKVDALRNTLATPDEALVAKLAGVQGQFERGAMELMVAESSREAARVYALSRELAAKDLSTWTGRSYEGRDSGPIASFLRKPAAEVAASSEWTEFVELQTRGARRFASFAAARKNAPAPNADEAAKRLLTLVLDRHDERNARRAAWKDAPPVELGLNPIVPGVTLALVVGLALVGRRVLRRRAA